MREIKQIIVHCTASPDSLDIGFKEINQWHKERGWASPSGVSCGYHYIVRRDGRYERGRPDRETGAHAKGYNSNSIGVVWCGDKYPQPKQVSALLELLRKLMKKYKVPVEKVLGHCEISEKTCPNIDMHWLRAELIFMPVNVADAERIVDEILDRPENK